MPNLTDLLLASSWLVLLYFFLPMFQLARVITDALAGRQDKASAAWKVVFVLSIVFVYLSYLVLARGMMQFAHDMTPTAEFPRESSGIGILGGVIMYCALTARSTWTRRKRRAN